MRIFIFFSESGARGAMKALAPELRAPVYARSLPDDVVLRNMRRALAALGEDDPARGDGVSAPENATSGGDDVAAGASSSASVVTALAAVELRRETRLWMAMMYKSTSQHRRAVHFQRMRGVTRSLRALAALDVGAAAVALRNGLRDGVSEEARETASSSPAVAAGAHALWKLPPRALWDDLSLRLREAARVAAEADDDMLAAAEALVGQLAHTFFMPFALVALAALARLRAAAHQLIADAAAAYNVLAPLLRGGIMPPPGLEPVTSGGDPPPEALACEWRAVSRARRRRRRARDAFLDAFFDEDRRRKKRARFSLPRSVFRRRWTERERFRADARVAERDPRDGPSRRGRGVSRRRRETRPDASERAASCPPPKTTRRPSGTRTGAGVFYRRFLFLWKARSMPVVRARARASPRRLPGRRKNFETVPFQPARSGRRRAPPRARGGREARPRGSQDVDRRGHGRFGRTRPFVFQGDVRVGPGDRHESDGHERVRVWVRRGVGGGSRR